MVEYYPATNKTYYYPPDQINSTRIITDSTGTVVYSAVFDPYGGLQKQWVNTYSPSLKFSGKEREARSELDYFGARYYDHLKYRFLSVDPVINKDEALVNPQFWNLYAYCRNNPITYFDLDGKESRLRINEHRVDFSNQIPNNPNYNKGLTKPSGPYGNNVSVSGNPKQLGDGSWHPTFNLELTLDIYYVKGQGVKAHEYRHAGDMIDAFYTLNDMLFEIQTNYSDFSFSKKEECANFTNMVVESGNNYLFSASKSSKFMRDTIGLKELFHLDTYTQYFPSHD